MGQRLQYAEIVELYPDEFVLLANAEKDERMRIASGELLWHSNSQQEVYDKALELRPSDSAFLFTGKLTRDVIVVV